MLAQLTGSPLAEPGVVDTVEPLWGVDTLAQAKRTLEADDGRHFLAALGRYLEAPGLMLGYRSGRMALTRLLEAAAGKSRSRVLICSYNCRAVAEAVNQAGLRPVTYDLASPIGMVDWQAVARDLDEHTLAVVIPHLFGVPSDFSALIRPASEKSVLLIEDCAHTVGARFGGRVAGTVGDAAIFSFNYDKPICLGSGGALLVNDAKLAERLSPEDPEATVPQEADFLRAIMAWFAWRKKWVGKAGGVDRLKRRLSAKFGSGRYPGMLPHRMGPLRGRLGLMQLTRFPAALRERNLRAQAVAAVPDWEGWSVPKDVEPAWLRQRVWPRESIDSAMVASKLQTAGLNAGNFNWPTTVDDYLGRAARPHARAAAQRGIDIPVHQNVEPAKLASIVEIMRK